MGRHLAEPPEPVKTFRTRSVSRETFLTMPTAPYLFTDTEIAENNVQNVLDVDPPGQPAEFRRGPS